MCTDAESECDEQRLMQQLFSNYDRRVRPRRNSSQTVNVQIRFNLQQINDLVRLYINCCQRRTFWSESVRAA